jgi:hypothetical protein
MNRLLLQDVRCFRGKHSAPIAPITLLIGEKIALSIVILLTRVGWETAGTPSWPRSSSGPCPRNASPRDSSSCLVDGPVEALESCVARAFARSLGLHEEELPCGPMYWREIRKSGWSAGFSHERDMRGERAALEDEAGAVQLEMKRSCQAVERIGSTLRPGPDDLIALPVLRYLERQIEGPALHLSGAKSSLFGIGLAQEG